MGRQAAIPAGTHGIAVAPDSFGEGCLGFSLNSAIQPPVPTASPLVREARNGTAYIQRVDPGELEGAIRKISIRQPL
jgi:hypothetical protein